MTARDERRIASAILQAEVSADLHAWAARYPFFASARFPALAATTVAYLPTVQRDGRALAALVSLWIVAFDTLVDEGDADAAALTALVTRYGALVTAAQGEHHVEPPHVAPSPFMAAAEQLDAALREIVALVDSYHPPSALRAWWEHSCRATIAAIVRQRAIGRADRPPGFVAALPLLVESIGVGPYLAVGTIIGHEPGLVTRLPLVKALADECSLAIRLANDLRTWEKDELEGGFNTLVALRTELMRATPVLPATDVRERAFRTLRSELTSSRARCHAHLAAATGSGATEAAMVRLMDVVVGIYATHDYHTYGPQVD